MDATKFSFDEASVVRCILSVLFKDIHLYVFTALVHRSWSLTTQSRVGYVQKEENEWGFDECDESPWVDTCFSLYQSYTSDKDFVGIESELRNMNMSCVCIGVLTADVEWPDCRLALSTFNIRYKLARLSSNEEMVSGFCTSWKLERRVGRTNFSFSLCTKIFTLSPELSKYWDQMCALKNRLSSKKRKWRSGDGSEVGRENSMTHITNWKAHIMVCRFCNG